MKLVKMDASAWVVFIAWLLMVAGLATWPSVDLHIRILSIGLLTAFIALVHILVSWSQRDNRQGDLGVVEILMLIFVIPNLMAIPFIGVLNLGQ